MRIDFADDVSAFLEAAEAAGVQHVTFLSAYGMEHAPDNVATRRVELDLLHRRTLGHTILRPGRTDLQVAVDKVGNHAGAGFAGRTEHECEEVSRVHDLYSGILP
jgi:uncharacterized protein YbjT (DUF2867 family)